MGKKEKLSREEKPSRGKEGRKKKFSKSNR